MSMRVTLSPEEEQELKELREWLELFRKIEEEKQKRMREILYSLEKLG